MAETASPSAAKRPAMKSDKIPSQTQRATSALREMIVNNRLPAGSSYLETELAEMLGMSRTPVREAAVVLESLGLVEVRPRRGIRILPLSSHDMEEIYEVLTELEGLAAEQAARRGLTDDEEAAVRKALDDMDKALASDDREAWADADSRFHDLLVSMSGNRRLRAIVASYNDQVQRARLLTVRLRPAPVQSNRDHRDLFDAILAGDGRRARKLHTSHRSAAKKVIIDILQRHGFHQI